MANAALEGAKPSGNAVVEGRFPIENPASRRTIQADAAGSYPSNGIAILGGSVAGESALRPLEKSSSAE